MVQATALPKPAPVKILNKSFLWTLIIMDIFFMKLNNQIRILDEQQ
jgi:hypothetical protein